MKRARRIIRFSRVGCLRWPLAMRWLAVLVILPLLAIGTFDGGKLLTDSRGSMRRADLNASAGPKKATDSRLPLKWAITSPFAVEDEDGELHREPESAPDTLPDHGQLPHRGLDLGKKAAPASGVFVLLVTTQLSPPDMPSSGWAELRGLHAGQRLVRTSNALLI